MFLNVYGRVSTCPVVLPHYIVWQILLSGGGVLFFWLQLDKLQRDFADEQSRYLRELEASSKDVQRLTCESQKQSLQAKEEASLEAARLQEELERAIRVHQSQVWLCFVCVERCNPKNSEGYIKGLL